VFRLQRDLGRQSHVAAMLTHVTMSGGTNDVIAGDARSQLSTNWNLAGQFAQSHTGVDPAGKSATTPVSGRALTSTLSRSGRGFNMTTVYTDISPSFDAPLGFIRRTNIRQLEQSASYNWWPKNGALVTWAPSASWSMTYGHNHVLQDRFAYAAVDFTFHKQIGLTINHYQAYELYGVGFLKHGTNVNGYVSTKRWLTLSGAFGSGTDINYTPAAGLAPSLGHASDGSLTATLRPSSRLRIDETYLFSKLQQRPGDTIFVNHLSRVRVGFQFSKTWSLRAIADYSALLPDSALINASTFKRLTGDLLLVYQTNPWTALYVGVTDRLDNVAFTADRTAIVPDIRARTSTGRQLFVKLSYLLPF
jgi:hypothetical protein